MTVKTSVKIPASLFSTLREIAEPKRNNLEHCDFCGNKIEPEHRHLVNLSVMQFKCACEVCAVIQSENGVYKSLPQRYLRLDDFKMSDELWAEFMIPVNMTFFVFNSARGGTVAYYPAPTGATESKLQLEAWKKLEVLNPVLQELTPDLEGLIVSRLDSPSLYYIVPIDICYKLIGMVRSSWKGLYGGREVNDTIRKFFGELNPRAKCLT